MSRFEALIPRERVRSCIVQWVAEDCPAFDVAGAVVDAATVGSGPHRALIKCKTAGVTICGLLLAQEIFNYLQCEYAGREAEHS